MMVTLLPANTNTAAREYKFPYVRVPEVTRIILYKALTSFAVSLNVVVMISIPFLSVLLSSVSPTVLTVIVELPSTNPNDETADFS